MIDPGVEVGPRTAVVLSTDDLGRLIGALIDRGHRVVGPTIRDGAITLGPISTDSDLPVGWGDEQSPGRYRLVRRQDEARFAYAVGPGGPRRELSPPTVTLVSIRGTTDDDGRAGFDVDTIDPTPPRPIAFFGVRPCEVAAMGVHHRVLVGGDHPDPVQAARTAGRFVVAVDCGHPASTCFCTSMGTGPAATQDYDLRLCELDTHDSSRHRFVCWVGSTAGQALLAEALDSPVAATDVDLAAALATTTAAADRITRRLDTADLPARLAAAPDHPRWDDVAERCLSCSNCTLVCPTCFCSDVHDQVSLDGSSTERVRVWDSCFALDHSYVHGGAVRASTRSRYRQWLTHKLSTWWDQFGESGCVGCGRCITWCPAGIDLVVEANAVGGDPPAAMPIGGAT